MRNYGIDAQNEFEKIWLAQGFRAAVHRFFDTADFTRERAARTGRSFSSAMIKLPEQPADFLIVSSSDGMFFAEVKSVSSFRFPLSSVRRSQANMGVAATKALKGTYQVFIRCELNKEWWKIPFESLIDYDQLGQKSIKLDELDGRFKWRLGCTTRT